MSNVNLIKLQHFFEVDNRIKKEMYNNLSTIEKYIDEDTMSKYTDNLEELLIYIFSELKCIALDIFGENSIILKKIEELEISTKNALYSCGLDVNKLKEFYEKYITNMKESFVNAVKQNCIGYTSFKNIPVNMVNSINEILHLMHSCIINNENVLQSVPMLAQKQNEYNYPITLRGSNIKSFNQIFEQFPSNLNVGWTDMVSLNEKKLLIMIRDRGHALTMEITINNNIARTEYFIPKICNIEMINNLPGINKVNENSVGATGVFETDIVYLSPMLFSFISRVPTDSDMIYEGKTR